MGEVLKPVIKASLSVSRAISDHLEIDGATDQLDLGVKADVIKHLGVSLGDSRDRVVVIAPDRDRCPLSTRVLNKSPRLFKVRAVVWTSVRAPINVEILIVTRHAWGQKAAAWGQVAGKQTRQRWLIEGIVDRLANTWIVEWPRSRIEEEEVGRGGWALSKPLSCLVSD